MKTGKIMFLSFFTNLGLSILKIVVGFLTKSSALIADGIHSSSDLFTDVVAIVGGFFSSKPADREHPYGHGRVEYITSLLIGVVVLLIGLTLIGNVSSKSAQVPGAIIILVSFFTILLKFFLSRYLIQKGKKLQNQILLSSGIESGADVYSSIVVLLSSILVQFGDTCSIFLYADKIAGIIVGIFIVRTGFLLLKENINILIGRSETKPEYEQRVRDCILKHPLVKSVDSLLMMKYGSYYTLTIELGMDASLSLEQIHQATKEIEKSLKQENEQTKYIHIHIHPEG